MLSAFLAAQLQLVQSHLYINLKFPQYLAHNFYLTLLKCHELGQSVKFLMYLCYYVSMTFYPMFAVVVI